RWISNQDLRPITIPRVDPLLTNKTLAITVLLPAIALGGGVMTFTFGIPHPPCSGVVSAVRNFTLIGNSNGYNDSVTPHQGPWPVMTVNHCDMVVIRVINQDTQSHGLGVDYYAPRGTEVVGGQSLTVQFQATKQGQFRVYCDLLTCSIHQFMEDGQLTVA
ncbi:hypothetical protein J2P12_08805, partial [Candidatus Bathyarchaeota archaeon]|nr:hypothetical protein [Candidatus Bathyarchaeota archaeon]